MALAEIALLGALTVTLGGVLGWAERRLRPTGGRLIDAIDLLLPQTQCERCGYPGCRPYAESVAGGGAINRCPPGGNATIAALASLLDRPVTPLDPELQPMDALAVALIDESRCIGCALCLPACPVDSIAGAAGFMHTVVVRHCTGCELCIPACPVDCIAMVAAPTPVPSNPYVRTTTAATDAKRRFEAHTRRSAARALAAEERSVQRQSRLAARRSWDDA